MIDVEDKMNSVIGDIRDLEHLKKVFEETQPEIVLHLAAQPIVRIHTKTLYILMKLMLWEQLISVNV